MFLCTSLAQTGFVKIEFYNVKLSNYNGSNIAFQTSRARAGLFIMSILSSTFVAVYHYLFSGSVEVPTK